MSTPKPGDTDALVDLAINRVLEAERDARVRVEQCRAAGEQAIAEATARAREVAARGERRVRLAHRLADRGIERALAELHATGSGDEALPPPDPAAVRALAATLALELTTRGTDEAPR